MGDFRSLAQLGLPVKAVVFNNGALKNPNFAAMVEAIGVRGIRLDAPADVEAKRLMAERD
jgi:pyruvate dehydrogenase (quinone)